MKYDFECTCGLIFEVSMSMSDYTSDHLCPECGKPASRYYASAPAMIVRGASKNSRDEEDFAPEHIAASIPQKAARRGMTTGQYEKMHLNDRRDEEEFWRDVKRTKGAGKKGEGGIRKVGEIPMAKALAMFKENGGDVPDAEQLKRRGCIYEHEKGNVT